MSAAFSMPVIARFCLRSIRTAHVMDPQAYWMQETGHVSRKAPRIDHIGIKPRRAATHAKWLTLNPVVGDRHVAGRLADAA